MTLQQLKYVVEVAERGSITEAAKALFIAQPSLSAAVRELEEEAGITIFLRNSRGILLTQEGAEFLGYARQVVQQAALIEDKYIAHSASRQRFSVSTQHYSFTSSAFVELVRAQGGQSYEFVLREGKTYDTIMDVRHLDLFEDVDLIQVGARNMQNFDLLKELGKTKKPILLKRGIAATMKELLMSAEYIMASGNEQVILCERGIRTYETYTRNTLDLSAVPMLHELSHLPVVVDPSHATGLARLVTPMALAATAGGADGIMVEVHNDPIHALCDGAQSLTPSQFAELSAKVMKVREAVSQ